MGREIRKVPSNWEHPKNEQGHYVPLNDEYYGDAVDEWYNNHKLWLEGKHPDQQMDNKPDYKFFSEWGGDAPSLEVYRKEKWTEEDATHFQMYETVSEGTPVSPVFETLEQLEDWLVGQGHSRKAAQAFCESGYAPSMTFTPERGLKMNLDSYDDF